MPTDDKKANEPPRKPALSPIHFTVFSIEVFGVGYNGAKKDALHRDFVQGDDDKGKWVLHAEQNCSGIVRSMGIEKVVYIKHYRLPVDLEHDRRAVWLDDRQLLQLVNEIQPRGTTPAARPPREGPPAKQASPGPQGEKPPLPNLQGQ